MGEKTITTQVKIDGEITPDFSFDWEVAFQWEKYIMPLRIPQGAKGNESLKSQIDLTFQHWAIYQLKRWPFVTIQQIAAGTYLPDEEVASVSLNLKDFCILFGQVLEYYYGGAITIQLNPDWQYKREATLITISHTLVWNVLIDAFHDKFGVRWAIEPREDNDNFTKGGERYVIKVGYPTAEVGHIFEYGFEGGLLKVERQVQSDEIRNMLKGRGGEKNLPLYYFKKSPDEDKWRSDPDWVEELSTIYFTNLRGATFRSYIQGWKAAHKSKYPRYTAVGENNAYSPWAYRKGFTDTKFHPVEFVVDEITLNPQEGDRQVQIYPDYSPYVKKGSSIDVYGPLLAPLDNNDDIYPTIQGTGLDIAVDVEQILSDDVAGSVESDAVISNVGKAKGVAENVAKASYKTIRIRGAYFEVPSRKTANFIDDTNILEVTNNGKRVENVITHASIANKSINIYNATTGARLSASGIPAGRYYYEIVAQVHNLTNDKTLNITVGAENPKLTSATLSDQWSNTFDIWVKNIWNTQKGIDKDGNVIKETDAQYAERVWKPILGDRDKNTAKVVFTSGDLLHEDYEFTIVDLPAPDTSKTYTDVNGVEHDSHWRITLAKSDAELEATGLYVPSTQKQGKAGDTFAFIGTEMTHVPYVVDAEIRLDDWKKDHLDEVKEVKPTFVVTTDRVRLNNEGKPDALINQLRVGNSLRIADKRFIQPMGDRAYETLYLQSLTYTFREPTPEDAALNPDVEIVLSNEYTTSANPVSVMQGEISSMQRLLGSISNVEQIVRAVGDKLYLRKDGISDISYSPTRFFSLLTSGDFRAGVVGGAGWGFFKDENGNWVVETDRVNVRQEMQINTLVINQAEGRGGMEVDTAAFMEVSHVVEADTSYICYFDQKGGSVANLFHVDDVAYCSRWTPENQALKFYKRRVVEVGFDYIALTKALSEANRPARWPDSGVNGSGIPEDKDIIIHFGNYEDATRQYVKVRDVIGGGYERFLEGLDSVNASGTEYCFIGRQAGVYGNRPRFFIGDSEGYVEWVEGRLIIKGEINAKSTIGGQNLPEYVSGAAGVSRNLLPGSESIIVEAGSGNYTNVMIALPFSVKKGETFSINIIGGIDLLFPENLSGLQQFSVRIYGDDNTNAIDGISGGATLSNINSSATFTLTADATSPRIVFYPGVWGQAAGRSARFNKVMFVKGATVPQEWYPSVYDSNYLTKALKESTVINGGLILTSLIKLGYTAEDGYRVMSGINGTYDASKQGGGLAFWAGGDMIDKADGTDNGASFGVRHDGSAYAANNTVRFGQNAVEVGDSVLLTDDGLFLLDENGNERLQVSNTEVSGGLDDISDVRRNLNESAQVITQLGLRTLQVLPSPGGGNSEISTEQVLVMTQQQTWEISPNELILPPNASLRINSLRLELSTRSAGLTQRQFVGYAEVRIGYYENGNRIYWRGPYQEQFYNSGGYLWSASFSIPTIKTSGESRQYFVEVTLLKGTSDSTSLAYSTTVSGEASGVIDISFESKTVLGKDGLLSIWGNAGLLATKNGITARCGNYILRISASGIQKSSQGGADGSWSTL